MLAISGSKGSSVCISDKDEMKGETFEIVRDGLIGHLSYQGKLNH